VSGCSRMKETVWIFSKLFIQIMTGSQIKMKTTSIRSSFSFSFSVKLLVLTADFVALHLCKP
jgi:hypothetical protein